MRKASQQQPDPSLASRPSRTKRRHSEVEEDAPTGGGRGLFSTIKKFIRGNAVKVKALLDRPRGFLAGETDGYVAHCKKKRTLLLLLLLLCGAISSQHLRASVPSGPSSALLLHYTSVQCLAAPSVMFPEKCLVECSSLSGEQEPALILALAHWLGAQRPEVETSGNSSWAKPSAKVKAPLLW